ncbi:hypothetical protein SMICM304S_03901 [Streptomyces microflavus]
MHTDRTGNAAGSTLLSKAREESRPVRGRVSRSSKYGISPSTTR